MKKSIALFLIFFTTVVSGICQQSDISPDSAVTNLYTQLYLFPQEKLYLQTDKPYYISGENIFFRIFLLNASSHQPVDYSRYVYLELIDPQDSLVLRQQIRPQENLFHGNLTIPVNLPQGDYQLRAYTRFMTNLPEEYFFSRNIHIVNPLAIDADSETDFSSLDNEWEITFYPEGGNLVANQLSDVAFKALKSDGNPLNIRGELYDSQKNKILDFATTHEGMGRFSFRPASGEKYHAICFRDNQPDRFELPEIKEEAWSLQSRWRQDKLWVSVNKPENHSEKLFLFIHCRGNMLYFQKWNPSDEIISFEKSEFPSGVSHLILLTEDFIPLSERLVFTLHQNWLTTKVSTQKESFEQRDLINLDVQLQNTNNENISGNFAISITDDKDIVPDMTRSILSEILLTSELKGTVRNPSYYFSQENKSAEWHADLLMMTHGWTRYDIPKALRSDFRHLTVPHEESQTLSGIVKGGLLSKPYQGSKVSLLSTEHGLYDIAETDSTGKFLFKDFELPDGTTYFVQALSKRSKGFSVELFLDEEQFPPIISYPKSIELPELMRDTVFQESVKKADLKYTMENGARMYNLDEVVIRGNRIIRTEDKALRYHNLKNVISGEDIVRGGGADMHSLIRRLGIRVHPHVNMPNGDIQDMMYIRGKLIPIPDELNNLDPYDLEAIGLVETPRGPMVVPVLKPFDERMKKPKFNIATTTPLGYHVPVEFYSPKYDTPEAKANTIPDLRSTIFWKPNVLFDSAGKANVKFYSADSSSSYSIMIEGVTDDGQLIYSREEAVIRVK